MCFLIKSYMKRLPPLLHLYANCEATGAGWLGISLGLRQEPLKPKSQRRTRSQSLHCTKLAFYYKGMVHTWKWYQSSHLTPGKQANEVISQHAWYCQVSVLILQHCNTLYFNINVTVQHFFTPLNTLKGLSRRKSLRNGEFYMTGSMSNVGYY